VKLPVLFATNIKPEVETIAQQIYNFMAPIVQVNFGIEAEYTYTRTIRNSVESVPE
jgi:hypothetical protein